MSELYPLLMTTAFDPRPWGTTDLSPIYPNHRFAEKIGEAWLTGDDCKVANGRLKNQTLAQLSIQFGRPMVGDAATHPDRFPLLTKFLFPQEKLSVQVHPDDQAAQAMGEPGGKTECWYVASARPGAKIGLGLKPGVTRSQFEASIHQNRAEELLHWINVYAGEMIYVAGGTVHTLGPGSVIVETQQQSDTTYRLYDYGRPRELHLERGLAVLKDNGPSGKVVRPVPYSEPGSRNRTSPLIAAPHFTVSLQELKEPNAFQTAHSSRKTSAQMLIAMEGCAIVEPLGSDPVAMAKGDAVVIPAELGKFSVRPQWSVEMLCASVPGAILPEPATRL